MSGRVTGSTYSRLRRRHAKGRFGPSATASANGRYLAQGGHSGNVAAMRAVSGSAFFASPAPSGCVTKLTNWLDVAGTTSMWLRHRPRRLPAGAGRRRGPLSATTVPGPMVRVAKASATWSATRMLERGDDGRIVELRSARAVFLLCWRDVNDRRAPLCKLVVRPETG